MYVCMYLLQKYHLKNYFFGYISFSTILKFQFFNTGLIVYVSAMTRRTGVVKCMAREREREREGDEEGENNKNYVCNKSPCVYVIKVPKCASTVKTTAVELQLY